MTKDLRAAKNFTNRLDSRGYGSDLGENVEIGNAECSLTRPVKASALRVNGFVMLHNNPCKIVNMATSKPGKHGHAKIHLWGLDVITGKKYEELSQSTHTMQVPVCTKKEYIVVDMGETGFLALMDDFGIVRHDIRVNDDVIKAKIGSQLEVVDRDDIVVTVLHVLDKEAVIAVKCGK